MNVRDPEDGAGGASAAAAPRIAVILPARDEEATVAACIAAFHAALPGARIVVVDNGSRDRTAERAHAALASLGAAGLVLAEVRPGKGAAVGRAFASVNADVYLLADADLTYPADRAADLVAPVIAGAAEMVVGDRRADGVYAGGATRRFHVAGNGLVCRLVGGLFGGSPRDVLSGYRALSGAFVRTFPIRSDGFELEAAMAAHALDRGLRVTEIPVAYAERPEGSASKLRTFRDGRRILLAILGLACRYRPLRTYGAVGLVAAALAFFAALPILAGAAGRIAPDPRTLGALAVGFLAVAAIALAAGIRGEIAARRDRTAFRAAFAAASGSAAPAHPSPRAGT